MTYKTELWKISMWTRDMVDGERQKMKLQFKLINRQVKYFKFSYGNLLLLVSHRDLPLRQPFFLWTMRSALCLPHSCVSMLTIQLLILLMNCPSYLSNQSILACRRKRISLPLDFRQQVLVRHKPISLNL